MNFCFNTRSILVGQIFALLFAPFLRSEDTVSFRADVAPILLDNCVACHNAKKAEGGYRLDMYSELIKAGDSETDPINKVGDVSGELIRRLTSDDEFERMPPESDPMPDDQIKLIRRWVDSGGKFDGDDPAKPLPFVIPPPTHPKPPDKYRAPVQVTALTFSPDGKQIFSGGYHETLVWDLDGKLVRRIENLGQQTFDIEWFPGGKQLAVACGQPGKSGEVRIVDLASGNILAVLARSTDVIWDVSFRPGTNQLAVASADKSIRLVNVDSREETLHLQSHADWVTGVHWAPDGKTLISASRDKSAKVFNVETEQLLVSYKGHGSAVRGLSVSADGKQVYSVGSDQKLHRWDLSNGRTLKTVGLGGDGFRPIAGSGWVLVPCSNRRILKVDVAKDQVLTELTGHDDWVLSVALSPDQSVVASGAYDGEIRLWNASDGKALKHWIAQP